MVLSDPTVEGLLFVELLQEVRLDLYTSMYYLYSAPW